MLNFKLTRVWKRLYSSSPSPNHLLNINTLLSTQIQDLATLQKSHGYVIATGHSNNIYISTRLISLYSSLHHPTTSTKLFNSLYIKDPFLWNSIIQAHFSNKDYQNALNFFAEMCYSGTLPNQFTIPMAVSACAELAFARLGKNIHALVSKLNIFHQNSAVGSSFVYMYSKCGHVRDASNVFDEILIKDVVAWTALVIGCVQNGLSEKGLECISRMHRIGRDQERPNFRTIEGGFQACGNLGALVQGRCLHGYGMKCGFLRSHIIQSSILSMYSKCESLEEANISFLEVMNKDLLSWTSIINIYAKIGRVNECVCMFSELLDNGISPDGLVISSVVSGFSNSMSMLEGKAFHGYILRKNFRVDHMVHNALLMMYCKFGLISISEKLFVGGIEPDTESWNVMLVGYSKAGLDVNCIDMFRETQQNKIASDSNSYVSVISSCSRLEATIQGRSVHCHVIKALIEDDVSIANSLIDMYGKGGKLLVARRIFNSMQKDIVTWNILISSYHLCGCSTEALALFEKMISEGIKPNIATLVIMLSLCSQNAILGKGKQIHDYIKSERLEHNTSIATALTDMYAKSGQLTKSREIFDAMKERDAVSWNVMISGYGMHGDTKSAIAIFQQMLQHNVKPTEVTFLAVLSACSFAGFVEEGKYLFSKMEEYFVKPTLKHYACMVDLLGRSGNLHEAEALVLSMSIPPDGGLWGTLLTACKLHNNVTMGIRIAKHAIASDPENEGYYIVLSDLYGSIGMWQEVEKVRNAMKEKGVRKSVGWSVA